MTDQQKLQFLLSRLRESANCKHRIDEYGDDYSPSDGGNYDDTFDDGRWYGEIEFARELLRHIACHPEPLLDTAPNVFKEVLR